MSLRTFLFAADALRLEEGVTFTIQPPAGTARAPRADVASKNTQGVHALMGMVSGAKKPGKARR